MKPDVDSTSHLTVLYESLIEQSTDALFALDSDGAIEVVNEPFTDLTGYARKRLVGRPLATLVRSEDREGWRRRLQFLLNDTTTDAESWVGRLVTRNGTTVEVEWQCTVLSVGDSNIVVGRVRDVRGGHQQEQKLKILNRVLRHNIRNQMNVIIGTAKILQEVDDEGYRAAAEKIEELGKDIVNISNKARKAQKHIGIPPDEDCNRDLVEATETACRQFAISYPNATVETELPERAHAIAPPSYNVALTELLENGVTHHPSGNGPVTVRITTDEQHASVTVADECEPIPDQITTTLTLGTEEPLRHNDGLGLWLVYWIVEPVGGELSFDRRDDDSGNLATLTFDRPLDRATSSG